jgi:hypothetical protein
VLGLTGTKTSSQVFVYGRMAVKSCLQQSGNTQAIRWSQSDPADIQMLDSIRQGM